jgi:hypothetical protein
MAESGILTTKTRLGTFTRAVPKEANEANIEWANDELASALLERIRAERGAASAAAQTGY